MKKSLHIILNTYIIHIIMTSTTNPTVSECKKDKFSFKKYKKCKWKTRVSKEVTHVVVLHWTAFCEAKLCKKTRKPKAPKEPGIRKTKKPS